MTYYAEIKLTPLYKTGRGVPSEVSIYGCGSAEEARACAWGWIDLWMRDNGGGYHIIFHVCRS